MRSEALESGCTVAAFNTLGDWVCTLATACAGRPLYGLWPAGQTGQICWSAMSTRETEFEQTVANHIRTLAGICLKFSRGLCSFLLLHGSLSKRYRVQIRTIEAIISRGHAPGVVDDGGGVRGQQQYCPRRMHRGTR